MNKTFNETMDDIVTEKHEKTITETMARCRCGSVRFRYTRPVHSVDEVFAVCAQCREQWAETKDWNVQIWELEPKTKEIQPTKRTFNEETKNEIIRSADGINYSFDKKPIKPTTIDIMMENMT